jgi:hypothetical protein
MAIIEHSVHLDLLKKSNKTKGGGGGGNLGRMCTGGGCLVVFLVNDVNIKINLSKYSK